MAKWSKAIAKTDNYVHQSLYLTLGKDLWIYGLNTQIAKYIVGGTQKPL